MKVYLVGGAVRDQLLGKDVQDKDYVVVGATPQTMLQLGYQQVGKDFPVFLHPKTKAEYALARTERKSGKGYKGFEVYASPDVSLEEDLKRRDITINAIAQDEAGNIIDPCGGKADLENKIIRHVTEAFVEDPLRVLRVARFHARFAEDGFSIAPETMELMRTLANSGELEALVPERVWVEVYKALMESRPDQFFLTLRDCGALKVLFPEIDNLFGVPQRKDYHPEIDTGIHTMMVLQQSVKLGGDAEVRFAALLHDLGKAETPADVLPRHVGHEQRSLPLIKKICQRFRVPKTYQKLALLVAEYHGGMHRISELKSTTLLKLMESLNVFRDASILEKFILACKADSLGRGGCEDNSYPQENFLRLAVEECQAITAKEFVENGLAGPAISEAMRHKRISCLKAFKKQYSD